MSRYIVMSADAKMPSSCWGRYRRVAVIETDLPVGEYPKMISPRAKGVVRIVQTWESRHAGSAHGAYSEAMREACLLADQLTWEQKAATAFGD